MMSDSCLYLGWLGVEPGGWGCLGSVNAPVEELLA